MEKEELNRQVVDSGDAATNPGDRDRNKDKSVSKSRLINKINYLNFMNTALRVNFKHRQNGKTIIHGARPQPCAGDILECLWVEPRDLRPVIDSYRFNHLLLSDGEVSIVVEPELIGMDDERISVRLPETGVIVNSRSHIRYPCAEVTARLIQNGSRFVGSLVDFSARAFRMELTSAPPETMAAIDPDSPANLDLSCPDGSSYTGECRIIHRNTGGKSLTIILEPLSHDARKQTQEKFRGDRYQLIPSPDIVFKHPFTGNRFERRVIDLSGTGFLVEEDENSAVLIPGMILPEAALRFAAGFRLKFKARVVYRERIEPDNGAGAVKCGIALLDMNPKDHVGLSAFLHQVHDRNSYVCNKVDLEELWDFFFETGFIYPGKYAHIQNNKEQIKKTYQKLYIQNPHIARHFIYQAKGRIMGHMSMLRFYQDSWLIHHHAARKSASQKAGPMALDQVSRFIHDAARLESMHMDYIICYYRPDNHFPDRVFGGAAKIIDGRQKCSIDTFAYFHCPEISSPEPALTGGWHVTGVQHQDMVDLKQFYEHTGGGVMLRALDLEPDVYGRGDISEDYHKLGFRRERDLYALKNNGIVKAIIIINTSEIGLNLSDLTNCVKVLVMDPEGLSKEVLVQALHLRMQQTGQMGMPVLLYPVCFAEERSIAYDKLYNLWAVHIKGQSDKYFNFLRRLLRFI